VRTLLVLFASVGLATAQWPAPKSPAVPEADGYVSIPNAALPPARANTYRAIFDATHAADKPTQLVPALNMAGSELNALATVSVPMNQARFVVVFHGPAVDGILDNPHYKAKFGVNNPNLPAIAAMKKRGVEFFVCGQYLAGEKIDPKTLTTDVKLAADALLVLMEYQNKGYALLNF
jgi:intracellular sulfur oxidation DsrE/DsrF family protein